MSTKAGGVMAKHSESLLVGDPYKQGGFYAVSVRAMDADGMQKSVATVYAGGPAGTLPTEDAVMANARLFAAAPELLEMVRRYASECDPCYGTGVNRNIIGGPAECGDCSDIRKLIGKAGG